MPVRQRPNTLLETDGNTILLYCRTILLGNSIFCTQQNQTLLGAMLHSCSMPWQQEGLIWLSIFLVAMHALVICILLELPRYFVLTLYLTLHCFPFSNLDSVHAFVGLGCVIL